MPVVQSDDILDLVTTTLRDLGRLRFQQIAQELPSYEVMSRLLRREKVSQEGGRGITRTLMTTVGGTAQHVDMQQTDDINIADLLTTMDVPWRQLTDHYAWGAQEVSMNRGKSLVNNILVPRRKAMMIRIVEELESSFFGAPPNVADTKEPYGLRFWIVYNATDGFTGGLPGDHTTLAGVNLTTNPTFKNYCSTFTTADWGFEATTSPIWHLRKAHKKIRFKSPVSIPDFRRGNGDRYRIWMNLDTIQNLEVQAWRQNQQVGFDLATYDDATTFKRHALVYVPRLDDYTNYPIFMTDMSVFHAIVLAGWYLKESPPLRIYNKHNWYVQHTDLSYNYACVDRRRCALLATGSF